MVFMGGVVLHDFFSTIGGGEKVALAIASCLDIDIITTDIGLDASFFAGRRVHSIGRVSGIPGVRQTAAALRFGLTRLADEYDYLICSGNWAHYAASPGIPSLYYCQDAPVRALYDLYPVFLKRQRPLARPFFKAWTAVMRQFDQRAARNARVIVSNSRSVRQRVQEYYHRDSPVIYPPVDTRSYYHREYGDFWLSVNRLYPDKRIDLQIEAFSRLPGMNLVIVGGFSSGDHAGSYARNILSLAERYPNISIITRGISEPELRDLYARCCGVVCTSRSEAFGMVPVEAMASGKPVIAVREGGFLETVTPECGVFINPDVSELVSALQTVASGPEGYRQHCLQRASEFDISVFSRLIREQVTGMTGEGL